MLPASAPGMGTPPNYLCAKASTPRSRLVWLLDRLPRPAWLRPLLIAAVALAIVIAGALVAGHTRWRSQSLAKDLVRALRAAGAGTAAVGRVSLVPLSGLTVDSLQVTYPAGRKGTFRLGIARAELGWRTFTFVRNYGRTRRTVRTLAAAGGGSRALALADSGWVAATFRGMHAAGIECSLRRDTGALVSASGGSVDVWPQHGPTRCSLALALDTLHASGVPLTALRSTGSLERSVLSVDTLTARVLGGALAGRTRLDLAAGRLDTLALAVRGAGLAARATQPDEGDLTVEGGVDLELRLGPGPLHRDSLRGEGRLSAGRLTAEELPVLVTLARILRAPALRRSAFDSLLADVAIRPGGLQVTRLAGYGATLSFTSSGWIGYDGSLRQKAQGRLGATVLRGLDPVVRHSLLPGPGGSGRFACTVKGTLAQPVVTLDQRMVERAVEGMFEQFRDELVQ
jgi:hypothetical protein